MHATFVTLWLQVVQPLANVHETKWTPHVKRETDVAQSYTSSDNIKSCISHLFQVGGTHHEVEGANHRSQNQTNCGT